MKLNLDKSYNFLIPYDVPVLRVGSRNDGGYIVPSRALNCNTVVSLGIGENWDFERHWRCLSPHSVIHCYDGTIVPEEFDTLLKNDYNNFFQESVTHFKENATVNNINNILACTNNEIFLKMDIEECEYDLIPSICKYSNIVGMVIEFHNIYRMHRKIRFKSAVESIAANYNIVHVHANNFGGSDKDNVPRILEISFLRKDLCGTTKQRHDVYLEGLDFPNDPTRQELELCFEPKDTIGAVL